MKKALAVITASCMILGCAPVMAAESTADSAAESTVESTDAAAEQIEWNWDDIIAEGGEEAQEVVAQGEFKTFDEVAVQIWVPNVLIQQEVTDADKEEGVIGCFMDEDETALAMVTYNEAGGASIQDLMEYLAGEETVEEMEYAVLNGLECVSYTDTELDANVVSFMTEGGKLLQFSFVPASDEDFEFVSSLMAASIMPEQAAETAESVAESAAESAAE
jgi:hypothetical protein